MSTVYRGSTTNLSYLGDEHATKIHQCIYFITCLGVKYVHSTKVMTPYGLRVTWQLPAVVPGKTGMTLTLHLKDNFKVGT